MIFKPKAGKGEGEWEGSIVRLDTRESDGALVPRVAAAKTTYGARGDKPVYFRTEVRYVFVFKKKLKLKHVLYSI